MFVGVVKVFVSHKKKKLCINLPHKWKSDFSVMQEGISLKRKFKYGMAYLNKNGMMCNSHCNINKGFKFSLPGSFFWGMPLH